MKLGQKGRTGQGGCVTTFQKKRLENFYSFHQFQPSFHTDPTVCKYLLRPKKVHLEKIFSANEMAPIYCQATILSNQQGNLKEIATFCGRAKAHKKVGHL